MRGLPLLTASASLPGAGETRGVGLDPLPAQPSGAGCSPYWLNVCLGAATIDRKRCQTGGAPFPPVWPPDPVGPCERRYREAVAACQELRGCPRGRQCGPDERVGPWGGWTTEGLGGCCPPNQAYCLNACVDRCPPPKVLDRDCRCGCPTPADCGPGAHVWDDELCECFCPPVACIGGAVSPRSCECVCPPGSKPCNGRCRDAQRDRQNCGGCGITCPSTQDCCNGTCVYACTDQHCAGCDPVAPGHRCCGCKEVDVAVDPNNCGACGQACDPQQHDACQGGRCRCRPGLTQCPPVPDCFDFYTIPFFEQSWLTWRATHPNDPVRFCDGCNTAAGIVSLVAPHGSPWCCPPGATWVDDQGQCHH